MNNLNSFQLNFYLLHLLQKFCVLEVWNPLRMNIRTVRGRESRDMGNDVMEDSSKNNLAQNNFRALQVPRSHCSCYVVSLYKQPYSTVNNGCCRVGSIVQFSGGCDQ